MAPASTICHHVGCNPSLDVHSITERSQPLQYELQKMGNYYVFGYGSPGNHFYDFKLRVN
ncbi:MULTISPECIES: hypothetical protein [Trichocoleus]|uniref:Uncharacterized protein n=1 Tax=Trichocoleus desertorum GB2-A4 TaxID=2933944 RepID=A0ABV0JC98_9CYAN|nr:hypothetical protein [Trichocoleus sp. FACHB-46]MBD1864066.1 hypothetical protein [Trichocoleus sp. FACHB-46]